MDPDRAWRCLYHSSNTHLRSTSTLSFSPTDFGQRQRQLQRQAPPPTTTTRTTDNAADDDRRQPTTMATDAYSPFFSSGLLASYGPHHHYQHARRRRSGTVSSDASVGSDSSGARMDVDDNDNDDDDEDDNRDCTPTRRSATPTPRTLSRTTPVPADRQQQQQQQPNANALLQPRLRRRRSSLTQAASPLAALRSPVARAGHALHAARTRSGSLSLGGEPTLPSGAQAQAQALNAPPPAGPLRARSGSCSGVLLPPAQASIPGASVAAAAAALAARRCVFHPALYLLSPICIDANLTPRPRRPVRRVGTAPVPGLRAPPPTAPLPALPLTPTAPGLPLTPTAPGMPHTPTAPALPHKPATSARARGLSVSSSTMDSEADRIDE